MKKTAMDVREIDCESIRVFVGRARAAEPFARLVKSMKETGLHIPIQVRDISGHPARERGRYRYELICGQGRIEAARKLGWKRIPALIVKAGEAEIVGRFLAENMLRKPLPWAVKARLMKEELEAGESAEAVAARFFVSPAHVEKCRRVLAKSAAGLEDEIAAMRMNDAEKLTTLPAADQGIVVAVAREEGQDAGIQALVARARAMKAEGGELSAGALRLSTTRVDRELARMRERLKTVRLHHTLGPVNLRQLLEDRRVRAALKKAGVLLGPFEGARR